MQEISVKVLNKAGLHARPAKDLAKYGRGIASKVVFEANGKKADIKSLMGIMAMGAKQGTEVKVTVDGADEAEVAKAISEMFESGFGEEC